MIILDNSDRVCYGMCMFILTWHHTRTRRPMTRTYPTWASAWLTVAMVRSIYPHHPMYLNGQPL